MWRRVAKFADVTEEVRRLKSFASYSGSDPFATRNAKAKTT